MKTLNQIVLVFTLLLSAFILQAQEYTVASFEQVTTDLTARVNPRVDNNGRKCAVLKVFVADGIAEVRGNVIGDVKVTGLEKQIYITDGSQQIELAFDNHFPLRINFIDYDYPVVTQQMVYVVKLVEAGAPAASMSQSASSAASPAYNSTASDGSNVETFTVNGVSFEMVRVEGGSFQMGSNDGYDNERPVHTETVSTFYIGKTEVTQALWSAVMGYKPSEFRGETNPVENISWDDCQEFIDQLNRLTGRNFRLPTEAEWEYAARGGNRSRGYSYSGSNDIDLVAWYDENSGGRTQPVAQKFDNILGIFDMSGNVWEWTSDAYSSNYLSQRVPFVRALRGGSYDNASSFCRVTFRDGYAPNSRSSLFGLRLAL